MKNDNVYADESQIGLDLMTHPTQLPENMFSRRVDRFLRWVGDQASWVWMILVTVILVNVITRHFFGQGRIEFEELQWHIYAIGFLIGLSYCYQADEHVRVDVLCERFSLKLKAYIELIGITLFLIPFVIFVLIYSEPFVRFSFTIAEVSAAPGGLPARWLIKACLPLGFFLLLLGAFSRLSKIFNFLFLKEKH